MAGTHGEDQPPPGLMSPPDPFSRDSLLSVTFLMWPFSLISNIQRTHLHANNYVLWICYYTGHTAQPTFPLNGLLPPGRTRHVPPTAHLQAALLGYTPPGALLQNTAVQLPEVGHVGLHDIQHFCLILSNHHPKVTWLKQAQNQFAHATSESALWTAGPQVTCEPQPPADTAPGQPGRVSLFETLAFHLQDANTAPRNAGTCLGGK